MLLHTVTVTVQRNIKVISPHDGMMAKCFQHDNFCHTLISVCECAVWILKMYQPGDGSESLIMCGFDCAMLNLDQLHPSV